MLLLVSLLFLMVLLVGVVSVVVVLTLARAQMDFATKNSQNHDWAKAIIFVLIECAF